jgi:hypothetical protein
MEHPYFIHTYFCKTLHGCFMMVYICRCYKHSYFMCQILPLALANGLKSESKSGFSRIHSQYEAKTKTKMLQLTVS